MFVVDTIVEAATRLLGTEGRTVTTNRVAAVAGVSVGSVYQYFRNKQTIFDEVARRHLADGERALFKVFDDHPVGSCELRTVVGEIAAVAVAENRSHGTAHGVLRALVDSAAILTAYEAFLDRLAERVVPYLIAEGYSHSDAQVSSVLAVTALEAQVHRLVGNPQWESDAIVRAVTDYTLRALAPGPGPLGCSCD